MSTHTASSEKPSLAAPVKAQTVTPRPSRVTPRTFVLGLLVSLGMGALTLYSDYFVAATYLSDNFFPISALGVVLVLTRTVTPLDGP